MKLAEISCSNNQVQELASSLEKSLERSAEIKKPAGAVALIHSTPNAGSTAPSKIAVCFFKIVDIPLHVSGIEALS